MLPALNLSPARLPHYATSLLNRTCDFFWERRLGIHTTGGGIERPNNEVHHYGYLAYHTYISIFDALQLGPDDVVADIGCGKGRVVCTAALYDIRESVGVEIDPELCAIAKENAVRMRGKHAPIRCACISATEFDYDAVTVIVMFHPFGSETMRQFIARLEASLIRRPRSLRIAYGNPLLAPMLAAQPWLERTDSWNPGRWSRIKFAVDFFRSVNRGPGKPIPRRRGREQAAS